MFELTGKVAVITGGNGVLGRSMCAALAKQGAVVIILGRKKETGDALVADLVAAGGKAEFFATDVLDVEKLKEVRDAVVAKYKHIDVLINAAGGNMPGACVQPDQSFFDADMDAVHKVMEVNYFGTLYSIKIFGEVIVKQGKGSIINISSASAEHPLTRVMGYSSAKAAIKNLTEWLAMEFASKYGDGIRVNAICPGFFLTEQNRFLLTNQDGSTTPRGTLVIHKTPMRRMGNPDDLQGALVYLASDESRFVTGTTLIVDGGFNSYSGV